MADEITTFEGALKYIDEHEAIIAKCYVDKREYAVSLVEIFRRINPEYEDANYSVEKQILVAAVNNFVYKNKQENEQTTFWLAHTEAQIRNLEKLKHVTKRNERKALIDERLKNGS